MKIITLLSTEVELVTPCFAHGHTPSGKGRLPEITGPSAKGMLRIWANRVRLNHQIDELFGSIRPPQKGKLIVRVETPEINTGEAHSLPHKGGGWQDCIKVGGKFKLHILGETRYKEDAERIAVAWITLGGIGLRKNRAAGSIWGELGNLDAVASLNDSWKAKPLKTGNPEDLRKLCSDTLAENAFRSIGCPLGGIDPRKPSEIEFKVIPQEEGHYLIAVFPTTTRDNLKKAGKILTDENKVIGKFLENL